MSKAEELAALRAFVRSLPVDSYIGKWLLSVLPLVESDIRSDIFPSATPADTVARCADLEKQAAGRAADLIERGKRDAAALVAAADEQCRAKVARVRERCAALSRAASAVSLAADAFTSAESKLVAAA